jgi:hypothetical protein
MRGSNDSISSDILDLGRTDIPTFRCRLNLFRSFPLSSGKTRTGQTGSSSSSSSSSSGSSTSFNAVAAAYLRRTSRVFDCPLTSDDRRCRRVGARWVEEITKEIDRGGIGLMALNKSLDDARLLKRAPSLGIRDILSDLDLHANDIIDRRKSLLILAESVT